MQEMIKEVKGNGKLSECLKDYEECIKDDLKKIKTDAKKKESKVKNKNFKEFNKLVKNKNVLNDFKYFKKMDLDMQEKIIKELKAVNMVTNVSKPYRISLLESDIPEVYKSIALRFTS